MTIAYEELKGKKPQRGVGLLVLIIAVFIIAAIAFVGNDATQWQSDHDVMQELDSLWFGFQSLFRGDIGGFFDGLVDGVPLIALFLVLFALSHFLFTTVLGRLFKKRTATILAVVVASYGFFDHRVYNYLLSLNAFAVGFLVFCALLIMLWGFSRHASRTYSDDVKQKNLKGLRSQKNSSRQQMRARREAIHMQDKGFTLENFSGKPVWVKYNKNGKIKDKIKPKYFGE